MDLVTEMDRLIDAKLEELSTDRNIEKFLKDIHWSVPCIATYIKHRAYCRKETMRIAESFSAQYAPNSAKPSTSYATCGVSGKQKADGENIKRQKAVIKIRGLKKVLKRIRRAKEESRELNANICELKNNVDALNESLERFNDLRKKSDIRLGRRHDL